MDFAFVAFVAAPLLLIGFVSLHDDPGLLHPRVRAYVKFVTDPYDRGVLSDTLALRGKTVLLTALFGYPIAGIYTARSPLHLLYTPGAMTVAMAQVELPLMVFSLIAALGGIDAGLAKASSALGAGPWRTWRRVLLPLSIPGLLTGTLLVFTGAVNALITQTLVGGGRLMYMPFYIYEQAIQAQDFPFAAALAIVLLVSIVAIVAILKALGRRSRAFVHA